MWSVSFGMTPNRAKMTSVLYVGRCSFFFFFSPQGLETVCLLKCSKLRSCLSDSWCFVGQLFSFIYFFNQEKLLPENEEGGILSLQGMWILEHWRVTDMGWGLPMPWNSGSLVNVKHSCWHQGALPHYLLQTQPCSLFCITTNSLPSFFFLFVDSCCGGWV